MKKKPSDFLLLTSLFPFFPVHNSLHKPVRDAGVFIKEEISTGLSTASFRRRKYPLMDIPTGYEEEEAIYRYLYS